MSSGVNANVDVGGLIDMATGVSSARSYEYTRRLQKHAMNFQREMSNTAHQREVADLKAAGLNPILSANGGADGGNVGGGDISGGQPAEMSMDPVSAYATLKQTENQTNKTETDIKNETEQTKADVIKKLAEAGLTQKQIKYYITQVNKTIADTQNAKAQANRTQNIQKGEQSREWIKTIGDVLANFVPR